MAVASSISWVIHGQLQIQIEAGRRPWTEEICSQGDRRFAFINRGVQCADNTGDIDKIAGQLPEGNEWLHDW